MTIPSTRGKLKWKSGSLWWVRHQIMGSIMLACRLVCLAFFDTNTIFDSRDPEYPRICSLCTFHAQPLNLIWDSWTQKRRSRPQSVWGKWRCKLIKDNICGSRPLFYSNVDLDGCRFRNSRLKLCPNHSQLWYRFSKDPSRGDKKRRAQLLTTSED